MSYFLPKVNIAFKTMKDIHTYWKKYISRRINSSMIPGIIIGYLGTTIVNILTQFSEDFFLRTHSLIYHVKHFLKKNGLLHLFM